MQEEGARSLGPQRCITMLFQIWSQSEPRDRRNNRRQTIQCTSAVRSRAICRTFSIVQGSVEMPRRRNSIGGSAGENQAMINPRDKTVESIAGRPRQVARDRDRSGPRYKAPSAHSRRFCQKILTGAVTGNPRNGSAERRCSKVCGRSQWPGFAAPSWSANRAGPYSGTENGKLCRFWISEPSTAGSDGQPSSIRVFIKSAGQTRLIGTLVNASIGGSLPSGRPTMWWPKCASTPAR
jgi:hypothetical protein